MLTYCCVMQLSFLSLFSRTRRSNPKPVLSDNALLQLWGELIDKYYPERQDLKQYHVQWSRRRQRRTLGSCNMSKRRVRIAEELNRPDLFRWAEAVLYHELCHAVLGTEVFSRCGRRAWHGKEFKELETRHPDSAALDAWVRSGGWARAVRGARTRSYWKKRKVAASR